MHKQVIQPYRKLFLYGLIPLLTSALIALIYSKVAEILLEKNIKDSINSTLFDYKIFFAHIENEYKSNQLNSLDTLSLNQTLYLGGRQPIVIGTVKLSVKNKAHQKIEEKNAQISIFHLMENEQHVLYSKAHVNVDLIADPMVELGYGFTSISNDFIVLSTTILLEDFFNPLSDVQVSLTNADKSVIDTTTVYVDTLGVYVSKKLNLIMLALIILIFNITYIALLFAIKLQKQKRALQFFRDENGTLSKMLVEKKSALRYIEKTLFFNLQCSHVETIDIKIILDEVVRTKQTLLSHKNIQFLFNDAPLPLVFKGHLVYWRLFLDATLDLFIDNYPADSTITCHLCVSDDQTHAPFYQLIFKDDLPIRSQTFTKPHDYVVTHNDDTALTLKALIDKINVFIDLSFSTTEGNTLTVAIPPPTPNATLKNKSNVISLVR